MTPLFLHISYISAKSQKNFSVFKKIFFEKKLNKRIPSNQLKSLDYRVIVQLFDSIFQKIFLFFCGNPSKTKKIP